MNAFKHGLAAIQKRREEASPPSTRRTSTHRIGWIPRLQIADGFDLKVHIWASGEWDSLVGPQLRPALSPLGPIKGNGE